MDPHRDRVQGRSHHQSRGRPPARLVAADDRGREVKTAERALRTVGPISSTRGLWALRRGPLGALCDAASTETVTARLSAMDP